MRIILISIIAFFLCLSCIREKDNNDDHEARLLFDTSALLIKDFSNKFLKAIDSIQIDSLDKSFEKKMIEINFSVPPETDLRLTEQENDSLYKLLMILYQIRLDKLKEIGEPSVTKDSLENQ